MTQPDQQVLVIPPNTAYSKPYITLSNVSPVPTPTGFAVSFDTDVACQCQMPWWPTQNPQSGPGFLSGPADASPVTHHTLAVNIGASAAGQSYQFQLVLSAADTTNLIFRAYQGSVQILGARAAAGMVIPVKFFTYGTSYPPTPGNQQGNWSTYSWSQWNPKGT